MQTLHKVIYGVAIAAASVIYVLTVTSISSEGVRNIRLAEWYALMGLGFLYLALLITPLYRAFPSLPWKDAALSSVKPFAVVAFAFGLVHGYIAFFKMLGGFPGLGFLSPKYINAVILSATALVSLCLGMLFSSTWLQQKFTGAKSVLLVCLHIAGLVTIIHAVMLGAHFADLTKFIPQLVLYLLLALLILDSYWLDRLVAEKFQVGNSFGLLFLVLFAAVVSAYVWYTFPSSMSTGVGIHAQHLQMLQQQEGAPNAWDRYTLNITTEPNIVPGRDTTLAFKVFRSATGEQIKDFTIIHDKLMHLIIVNNDLTHYQHIHPELQSNGTFTVTTSFPNNDLYRLYTTFQPAGGTEQEVAQTVPVGNFALTSPVRAPDENDTKTFGDVRVQMLGGTIMSSAQAGSANAKMIFEFTDTAGNPITSLRPYLGAFGHLVMLNTSTYEYIHVHPVYAPISPEETAGPAVEFMFMNGVQPGVYRVFLDSNPGGSVFTADFTVQVK